MRSSIRETVQLTVNLLTGPKGSAGNLCRFEKEQTVYFLPQYRLFSRKSRVEWNLDNYRPQPSCGRVMFSQASVILITGVCVADTPRADTPLGRHPPFPMHAGIHTPLPSACWDTPPGGHCTRRYASYWNAFLLKFRNEGNRHISEYKRPWS